MSYRVSPALLAAAGCFIALAALLPGREFPPSPGWWCVAGSMTLIASCSERHGRSHLTPGVGTTSPGGMNGLARLRTRRCRSWLVTGMLVIADTGRDRYASLVVDDGACCPQFGLADAVVVAAQLFRGHWSLSRRSADVELPASARS